jgi:hypothetical protein
MGGLLRDPDGSLSSARVGALACVVVGCGVAIAGMALDREQAATVAALLGGGGVAYLSRTKSVAP